MTPHDIDVTHALVHEIDCDKSILDDDERQRAARFRFDRDRQRFIAAHVLLRRALATRLELTANDIEFAPVTTVGAARSKPELSPAQAASGVRFSLSHSGPHLLVATGHRELGVDVEVMVRAQSAAAVVGSLHPTETDQLTRLPVNDLPAALTLVWARKESLLKALGTGLSRTPDLDYVGADPNPNQPIPGWVTVDLDVSATARAALTWREG